jgi:hypothetical protein
MAAATVINQLPTDVERFYLNELATKDAGWHQCAQNLWEQARAAHPCAPMTPAEIAGIINFLQQCLQYLGSFGQLIQWLNNAGLYQFSQQVMQIGNNIQASLQTYGQMYQSAMAAQAQWMQIQANVNANWIQTMGQINAHTQDVFDRQNRIWNLVNSGVSYVQAQAIVAAGGG